MAHNNRMIWYASYGSNMLAERFRCYISGGRPEGAQRTYKGCTNRIFPEKIKPVRIPAELYFARRSKTWHGGGICFLKPEIDENQTTLGRMYLIAPDQFCELVKQESRYEGDLHLDLEQAIEQGSMLLPINSWYAKILFLGYEEGQPVFTFTCTGFLEKELNPPHPAYLNMIRSGLKETYGMGELEITEYLEGKKGFSL